MTGRGEREKGRVRMEEKWVIWKRETEMEERDRWGTRELEEYMRGKIRGNGERMTEKGKEWEVGKRKLEKNERYVGGRVWKTV